MDASLILDDRSPITVREQRRHFRTLVWGLWFDRRGWLGYLAVPVALILIAPYAALIWLDRDQVRYVATCFGPAYLAALILYMVCGASASPQGLARAAMLNDAPGGPVAWLGEMARSIRWMGMLLGILASMGWRISESRMFIFIEDLGGAALLMVAVSFGAVVGWSFASNVVSARIRAGLVSPGGSLFFPIPTALFVGWTLVALPSALKPSTCGTSLGSALVATTVLGAAFWSVSFWQATRLENAINRMIGPR